MSRKMADPSENQDQNREAEQPIEPSQISPSFDFDALINENYEAESQIPPPQDDVDMLDYSNFSNFDFAPAIIPYPMEDEQPEVEETQDPEPDNRQDASQLQPLPVPTQLEAPRPNHGSVSVPITVTSPLRWQSPPSYSNQYNQRNQQSYNQVPYSQANQPPYKQPNPQSYNQPSYAQPSAQQPYNYFPQSYGSQPSIAAPFPQNQWPNFGPITRPSSALGRSRSIPRPANQTPGGSYQNSILSSFTHPSTPLRVIDTYKFPFEEELQRALQIELQRQNELAEKQQMANSWQRELNRRKESNEVLEAKLALLAQDLPEPIEPSPTPIGDGTKTPRNRRPINISNTDPKKWYRPLPMRPDSWGSINPDTQDWTFNYTADGELNPRDQFTVSQMSEYIASKRATLWIQVAPADSGRRYPTKTSDKCRFIDCPDPNHTIRKGDFRVAFDEHPSNPHKDPFHNAAYTHLFCLEKSLDFPQICKNFDVRPDTRVLKEGKNKMAVTRDHHSMENIVSDFIRDSLPWQDFPGGLRPVEYYEYTLCYQLTVEHLAKQPKHLQAIREQRGGNTIDKHMNNLDKYVATQREKKRVADSRPEKERPIKKRKKSRGKEADVMSNESGLDEEILQRGFGAETNAPSAYSHSPDSSIHPPSPYLVTTPLPPLHEQPQHPSSHPSPPPSQLKHHQTQPKGSPSQPRSLRKSTLTLPLPPLTPSCSHPLSPTPSQSCQSPQPPHQPPPKKRKSSSQIENLTRHDSLFSEDSEDEEKYDQLYKRLRNGKRVPSVDLDE